MQKKNRNLVLTLLILAIAFIFLLTNIKTIRNMNSGIFSKELTEKTSETVTNIVDEEEYLIYINIDGLSFSTFEKANQNPVTETKNINELIERGVLFTNAKTGIPSITSAMQQSIVSGAWPIDTGNCYRYYDFNKEEVVQYSRENKLENVAEAANKEGIDQVAINSWYFKERGTNQEKESLYIRDLDYNGYDGRLEILNKILKGEEIEVYGKKAKYETPPKFISIYFDEVDGAAHNLSDKSNIDSRLDLETRKDVEDKMVEHLHNIDTGIGEAMEILKSRGLFAKTTFVITTDHGTVPFGADDKIEADKKDYAYSKMPDMLDTISKVGSKHLGKDFKVELASIKGDKASKDSDVVVTSPGLQAQIRFRKQPSEEFLRDLVNAIKEKPYYGDHLTKDELTVKGVPPRFADLLISPKAPYHFSHDFKRPYYAVNQHDSLDERVTNIFSMVSGPSIKNIKEYDKEIYNIDMAPTMARILGFEGPSGTTASVLDDVLIDELKGSKLEVIGFKDKVKEVSTDSFNIKIETEKDALININKKEVGDANRKGEFEIEQELKEGVNRFIIESIKNERITRRVVFVIKR